MPPPNQSATTDSATDPGEEGLGILGLIRPLTRDLVTETLAAQGWSCEIDDDGDLFGVWEETPVYFRVSHESVLQLTSVFRVDPVPDDPRGLYEFCNEWNRKRLWPKAYVTITDGAEGGQPAATIFGEVTTHLPHGVTIDQLDKLVRCGIGTACQLTAALSERNG